MLQKQEDPEKNTDLSKVTDKLYHIMVVIGTDCIGSCKYEIVNSFNHKIYFCWHHL
jgi:hypothetical protein